VFGGVKSLFDLQKWFDARPATALEQIEAAVSKAAAVTK